MVTRRSRALSKRPRYLFITEWMAERGVGDEALSRKLDVDRVTVTRYRNEQHRLNPEKIARIAQALDLEPQELWRSPDRPSLDAKLSTAPDEIVKKAADMLDILWKSDAR